MDSLKRQPPESQNRFNTRSFPETTKVDGTIAVGANAVASDTAAVALGTSAQASHANEVALGSGSQTGTVHTGAYWLNPNDTIAGVSNATNGVVSVGAVRAERQIQNIGAGVVSETSTDAVNGSQLFALSSVVNNLMPSGGSLLLVRQPI